MDPQYITDQNSDSIFDLYIVTAELETKTISIMSLMTERISI